MKELYFIFETVVLASYEKRYGFKFFEEHGFKVNVLELSPILAPAAYECVTDGLYTGTNKIVFKTRKEYKHFMKTTADNAFFLITMDFNAWNIWIYFYFKSGQRYGYISRMDTNLEINLPKSMILNAVRTNITFQFIWGAIVTKIPQCLLPLKKARFIILGGLANADLYTRLALHNAKTRIEYIHSLDYENYLQIMDKPRIIHEKYCVFIDQYIPYHSDGKQIGVVIDANRYYSELREFFRTIEKRLGIKVVIAAHPRSNYELHDDCYNGFDVIKFHTAELIKDCEFVINHFSTSVSYCAIYDKPICFITDNELNKSQRFFVVLEAYKNLFGVDRILNVSNMDEVLNFASYIIDDREKRRNFLLDYVKGNFDCKEMLYTSFYPRLLSIVEECINVN